MSTQALRKLLLKQPRPASLRITVGDEVHALDVPPVPHWGEVAASVTALKPDLVEMLNAKGSLIRAVTAEQFTGEDDARPEDSPKSAGAFDAETHRLECFAKLIARAYEHSTNVAFEKFVELFEVANQRIEIVERARDADSKLLRKVLEENADLAVDADSNKDPLTELLGKFFDAKAQGELAAALKAAGMGGTNGKATNGKAKAPPPKGEA